MIPDLIKFFNCVAVKPDTPLLSPEIVNQLAAKCGYLVHPFACTEDVVKFLKSRVDNYNTTFYSSWKDVDSLQEAEMKVLQLLHYISTYGTDFQGTTFTMNDFPEDMRFAEFKIIMPCTERELFDRILSMLESGIALASETSDLLVEQLIIFSDENNWEIDIDRIKNKEARAKYYISKGIFPYEPFDLMRIIMQEARGNTLIINDTRTFDGLYHNIGNLIKLFAEFDESHIKSLATIFYRYKKIFLLLRWNAVHSIYPQRNKLVRTVNEIRRQARKLHKPFRPAVTNSILSPHHILEEISEAVEKTDSKFQLVRLLNYLNCKKNPSAFRIYKIRNNRIWMSAKPNQRLDSEQLNRIEKIYGIVEKRLISLLGEKSRKQDGSEVTVKFPQNIDIAAPVSEKMFIGPMPYGTKFPLHQNNYIGIYWRNEWGTRDFDLWVEDASGRRIGWAASLKEGELLFSGDMTNAEPEATEIMYCRGPWPDSNLRVVRYCGAPNSKFRLFFGSDNLSELPLNYMVNPNTIRFREEFYSDLREMTVAVISDNTVYFTAFGISDARIPLNIENSGVTLFKSIAENLSNHVSLKEILLKAGFKEYNPDDDTNPDIDLENELNKDTLISLFS